MPVIQQPSNQIKLTNVSLVRIKKGKKRFEIACYKNKVLEWRSGIEKDLDNVLQIPNVFTNVSKGQVAPKADLQKAFGAKATTDEIVLEILNKGELQVGDKERHAQLDRVHHEVIDIVAGKLVDPRTKRVYTTGMIEKALEQLSSQSQAAQKEGDKAEGAKAEGAKAEGAKTEGAAADPAEEKPRAEDKGKGKELPKWTGVVTTKSAKSQALDAMKALIAHQPIPVARARMRLRVTCPTSILKQAVKSAPKPHGHNSGDAENADEKPQHGTVKETILGLVEQVESQDVTGDEWEVIGFVEPGAFKALTEFIGGQTKGRGRAEVLDMAVVNEDD
ncbi:SBDS protein C-terminal domain-domain-containing protein [Clohesyomyces aquaticus]|uniref:Ribosome maturation protein SDO1 n=1 Tax=Clohesyomyces aquaticus TaxID=1231657 RepID=A0A1Y2A244_9PLEO|nr:SBDS protein C-terminal domain-domain-containing protein [Clohesyomyces aquaticus]